MRVIQMAQSNDLADVDAIRKAAAVKTESAMVIMPDDTVRYV